MSFAMDTTSTATTDCYRYYSSPTIAGPGFADASSIGSSIRLILCSLGPTVTVTEGNCLCKLVLFVHNSYILKLS